MSRPRSSGIGDGPLARNVLLLPVILVLPCVSLGLRFVWRDALHAYVEEREWYGLGLLEIVVLAWVVGLVGWAACWLMVRRRRALLIAQVATALVGTLVVQGFLVVEAVESPAADHESEIARQEAAADAADAGARAYWQELPAWLASLPGHAVASFPPVPLGQRIVWKGVPFPATGITPDVDIPFADSPVYVVQGSTKHLLVLADNQVPDPVDARHGLDLVDIPATGAKRVVAHGVTSAVSDPEGTGYAFTDGAALVAHRPSGTVTTRIDGARVWGWRRDGIVLTDGAGALRRWLPDQPARPPQPLSASSSTVGDAEGTVVVPPRGNRMLVIVCPAPVGAAASIPRQLPEPFVGFDGGVWPATLHPHDPTHPQGCGSSRNAQLLTTAGTLVRSAPEGLDLSPDGRYVVSAGLRVLDVDTGVRTALVAPSVQDTFLRIEHGFEIDPIDTGFWHDDRTVEITAGGSPVAVCTLPSGPCSRTGTPLPSRNGTQTPSPPLTPAGAVPTRASP